MTPIRRDILQGLEELTQLYPEWRFGQLVANVAYWSKEPTTEAVWDVEDVEFLNGIRSHLEQRADRQPQPFAPHSPGG
jgi:hypothetical protein